MVVIVWVDGSRKYATSSVLSLSESLVWCCYIATSFLFHLMPFLLAPPCIVHYFTSLNADNSVVSYLEQYHSIVRVFHEEELQFSQ